MNRHWTVRLKDVALIERTGVAPGDIAEGTTYVGLEHIASGGGHLSSVIVEAGELASSKFRFTGHHILYGKLRPYLAKIVAPGFDGVCSTDILPIRPGPQIDKRYLLHYLRLPENVAWAAGRATGVNLPRLSPTELGELSIPLPPLDEQRRIAAILDKADALRQKRKRAIALLDSLTQSIFLEMFGDPETNPLRWPTLLFGDLIGEGPTNGLYRPASDYGSGTPILRIDAFYDGSVTDMKSLKRLRLSDKELSAFALREGDIVVNRVNSLEYLGKSAIIPSLLEPTVYESNMMRLRVDSRRALPTFIIGYLQTQWVKKQVARKAKKAVNQASINQGDVKSLSFYVPPIELQHLFDTRRRAVVRLADSLQSALKLDALFSSLQHRAFSGQL